MALWPFRRKSGRKRSRSGATLSDNEVAPLHNQIDVGLARTASKKARTEPAKLQRRQRSYSFSPGRNDSIRIERTRRNMIRGNRDGRGHKTALGNSTEWERMPTLHPTRRKSSKRRREDHDREAEIKAMSSHMPSRLATDSYGSSAPKQSTKRAKTGDLEHHHEPPSQVSLPYPDSVLSAMSVDSDSIAYKLSALDSLAPRPTLIYAPSNRWAPSRTAMPATTEHLRKPIEEDPFNSRKRIDDLADDLDAKDLRELMERDHRRRERKKLQDQERLEKRLARRAEWNQREEFEAKKSGSPAPENLERGVLGRELVGLGIDPASTIVTSSKRRDASSMPGAPAESDGLRRTEPLASFHRPETSPKDDEDALPEERPQRPSRGRPEVDETVSSLPEVPRLGGVLNSKKSNSKSTLGSDKDRLIEEEFGHKNSEGSNRASNRLSFTSLLKWGSKNKRYSGPSSFSNTSREEMWQAGANPHNIAQAEALARLQGDDASNQSHILANKPASVIPKRTKSRFREDLPEFPLSPPDSRVQSPEAEPPFVVLAEKSPDVGSRPTPPMGDDFPTALERPKAFINHEPHMSMSLASIDSEGSWLSGRMGSLQAAKHDSLARANRRDRAHSSHSLANSAQEHHESVDDEYLSQFAPDRNLIAVAASLPLAEDSPSSEGGESATHENLKWGRVGLKPEVIQYHHHDREMMRSCQGLLNIDSEDEEKACAPSPSGPT